MMPAGKYYVGDLCYVLDDAWDDFCAATIVGNSVLDGEFKLNDGRVVASYKTAYGDGVYRDQNGRNYPVDAGLIGCIKVEDINQEIREDLGNIITFNDSFSTSSRNGIIYFGNVQIDTDPPYEDDDWYEDDTEDDGDE